METIQSEAKGAIIAIIGCGNMGRALAIRLSERNSILLYDHHFEKSKQLEQEGFGTACKDLHEAVMHSKVLILAVKPVSFKEIARQLVKFEPIDGMIVSLLSGMMLAQLRQAFPSHRLVRMMPNLAVSYGSGLIGLAVDRPLIESDQLLLTLLCNALGKVYWLKENQFNAFTALAGSGPAFALIMMESMVDAGIAMGFSSPIAQEIIQQMLRGSLDLWQKSARHPGDLKWQVTSPAGTTIAGIKMLEDSALRSGIINTFLAAFERANEMSKE